MSYRGSDHPLSSSLDQNARITITVVSSSVFNVQNTLIDMSYSLISKEPEAVSLFAALLYKRKIEFVDFSTTLNVLFQHPQGTEYYTVREISAR